MVAENKDQENMPLEQTDAVSPEIAPTDAVIENVAAENALTEELTVEQNTETLPETLGEVNLPPLEETTFTTDKVVTDLQAKIQDLQSQLESSNSQLENVKTGYMRTAADFDNFRKRTQKEKEELEQQIKASTLIKIIPVLDDFERARSLIKPQNEGEMNIHKSYQGVYKQLVEALKKLGVSPMRPEGKEFDPNLHEAVMRQATAEHPEGTVIEELIRGYFLGEKVLRHAMVKVAAPPENEPATTDQTETVES
jgi:molecular chaperone GrpE